MRDLMFMMEAWGNLLMCLGNYSGLNLLLNYELPLNVHEYDIFIED